MSALLPEATTALRLLDLHQSLAGAGRQREQQPEGGEQQQQQQQGPFTRLQTSDGVTPFHLAFQMGQFEIPTLLKAIKCTQVHLP